MAGGWKYKYKKHFKRIGIEPINLSDWVKNFWRKWKPLSEAHSIRQIFYREYPRIERFVPDAYKKIYPDWAGVIADEMYADLAWLVKWGELSYGDLNILNDSGASEHIWQGAWSYSAPPEEECFVEYPIEVWVENNATFNSLSELFGWNPEEKKPLKYRLNLVSGKGYAKAQQLEKLLRERPDVEVILYLSDFDPDGCNMPFAV